MSWRSRAVSIRDELAAIAEIDPRWWLLAGGVAAVEAWPSRAEHVVSDADPVADTFMGYPRPAPADPVGDAIARARAARLAIRDLDGELPDQRLAVTIRGNAVNGVAQHDAVSPSELAAAAFAIGDRCVVGALDDPTLAAQIARALDGAEPAPWRGPTPFVCVAIGDEPIATARHGHRRAWNHHGAGPWLGLGRADGLATVSTCHMIVDGYGHAWLASRIAHHHAQLAADVVAAPRAIPPLVVVPGAIPLGVAWRELAQPAPRSLPLAYALGCVLHRVVGRRDAPFSPTYQFPIAPGRRDDPMRPRRRAVGAALSVRFEDGKPEPFEQFAGRARGILARESEGRGLCARLLAAARAAPAPLAWKRRSISATRPRWLERFAEVIGGRACLSMIRVDAPLPPTCAVSSPARFADARDPLGACVITVVDDRERAAITACGSGIAGTHVTASTLLDELLVELERR